MQLSGFTYVRNGFRFGYPFLASIRSLLPVVDELVVVVGDSDDGTREALEKLKEPKIRLIDTVWDMRMREGGKLFAQQSNLGLLACRGEWLFHLQVDEVLHEQDYPLIHESLKQAAEHSSAEALVFPFLHFWGDYAHIRNTRRTHAFEVRAFKNKGIIRSYKDSQGFRKYPSQDAYAAGHLGTKLKSLLCPAPVYHYSYTRHPSLMKQKSNYFHRFWHGDQWLKENTRTEDFNFNEVDRLELFTGSHPAVMKEQIAAKNWDFVYDPKQSTMSLKDRFLEMVKKKTGKDFFSYRNYELLK